MEKIDEKIFIELYNTGKSSYELSQLLEIPQRTIETYEQRLRTHGKVRFRRDLCTTKQEKNKFKNSEIFQEVQVYIDNARTVLEKYDDVYKNVNFKGKFDKKKQTEDLALVWSDMHTGMINKNPLNGEVTYDREIQEQELEALLKGIKRFHQLYKPSYNVETFYIFDVGDNITNDRIFEGQKAEITCTVGEQILLTHHYQSDFIKKLLEIYPKVVIIKIPGNHGRTTARYMSEDATSSFEYLGAQLLKERFAGNKKVEVIVPDTYNYTATIRGHKYYLAHGNSIRGGSLNSIEKACKDLATLAYKEFYDLMIIGHFHTSLKLKITPTTTLLVNGCWIEMDDYAYNKLHKFSSATQYLFSISKKSPMHNLQEIYLKWR